MLKINGVSKVFKQRKKEFVAVNNLTLEVRRGEVFGLLGTNGAGKTTTLRMIATTLRPTSGTIAVDGIDTKVDPAGVRRRIGLLFGGDTGLYDRLTARENIEYFARLAGMEEEEISSRIAELGKHFEMQDYLDRRTAAFSRGMKQKTSFARAIVHNPELMLLDEPITGLDIVASEEVNRFIQLVKDQGKTVVLSSHDMTEVEQLCDRVAILDKGVLRAVGTIEELKQTYAKDTLKEVFFHLVEEGKKFE